MALRHALAEPVVLLLRAPQPRLQLPNHRVRLAQHLVHLRAAPTVSRTRRVLHPVLIGHAASFTPY